MDGNELDYPQPQEPDEEFQKRKTGWAAFYENLSKSPMMQQLLMQTGLRLMQPVPPGQTTLGHIAHGVGGGMEYVEALKGAEAKRAEMESEAKLREAQTKRLLEQDNPEYRQAQTDEMRARIRLLGAQATALEEKPTAAYPIHDMGGVPFTHNPATGQMLIADPKNPGSLIPMTPEAVAVWKKAITTEKEQKPEKAVFTDPMNIPHPLTGEAVRVGRDANGQVVYASTGQPVRPMKQASDGNVYEQLGKGQWRKVDPEEVAQQKMVTPANKTAAPRQLTTSDLQALASAKVDVASVRKNLFDKGGKINRSILYAMELMKRPGLITNEVAYRLPADLHDRADAVDRTMASLLALRGKIEFGLRGGATAINKEDEQRRYGISSRDTEVSAGRVLDRLERWLRVGEFISKNHRSPTDEELAGMLGKEEYSWFASHPTLPPEPGVPQ